MRTQGWPATGRRLARPVDQVQELRPGARIAAEGAEHAGRDHPPARRLNAAHLPAEMPRLHDDATAPRFQGAVQSLGDRLRHLLLELEPVRVDLDQAGDLAQAYHLAFRQVPDLDVAEEGQHVVLAEAVEGDVFDDDHLVVVLVEDRVSDDILRLDAVAIGQLAHRPRHPLCGRGQALATWTLAEPDPSRLAEPGERAAVYRLCLDH